MSPWLQDSVTVGFSFSVLLLSYYWGLANVTPDCRLVRVRAVTRALHSLLTWIPHHCFTHLIRTLLSLLRNHLAHCYLSHYKTRFSILNLDILPQISLYFCFTCHLCPTLLCQLHGMTYSAFSLLSLASNINQHASYQVQDRKNYTILLWAPCNLQAMRQ